MSGEGVAVCDLCGRAEMHDHDPAEYEGPDDREWYLDVDGTQFGPFTADERTEIDATREPGVTLHWVEVEQ